MVLPHPYIPHPKSSLDIGRTSAHCAHMDHFQNMHDNKQAAAESILRLEKLAIGASPQELSIINKMIDVAKNNIEIAELEYSAHLIIENARNKAA